MDLLQGFKHYCRAFSSAPQIPTSSQKIQENHAKQVEQWLELTATLKYMSPKEMRVAEDILADALKSARYLFIMGDEISAWVGQQRIAAVAHKIFPGKMACDHLAAAARFGVYQYLLCEAEETLELMHGHFKETDHPLAAQYWELKGMIVSFRKNWMDAIPYYQLAREHIELSSQIEIRHYFKTSREDCLAHQNLRIADCLTFQSWRTDHGDRQTLIRRIESHLRKAKQYKTSAMIKYLTGLNEVELLLLKDELVDARLNIKKLLDSRNLNSRKTSILHPGAFVMKARLADLEGDQTAMISFLSRALSESTLMFPDVMQELQVVDYALDMISRNAMTRKQWQPLLEAMVVMLEAKDWYTGRNHSKCVARTAIKLWKSWKPEQCDKAFLEDLYWAGYLHDIGKLRLPRSLLNKIAPLDKSEWAIIHRHPAFTRDMLESLGADRIGEWAGQHHQDLDGNGYPGNEPASDVGLCIGVADILEAATSSDRKYSKPKSISEIIQFLRNSRKRRYPPDLLDIADQVLT